MAVSKDEVLWCYRMILGRDPESAEVVQRQMQNHSLATLRESFFNSPEFLKKRKDLSAPGFRSLFFPLDLPRNEIEYAVTEAQLAACLDHISPLRSGSAPKRSPAKDPEGTSDHFSASDDDEAVRVERLLARHDFGPLSAKTCLAYGCGSGRLTVGLTSRFSQVHVYDTLQDPLSLAEQRVKKAGAPNCRFHFCGQNILGPMEKCDFFYSETAFRHLPPPVIHRLIKNALQALTPGGLAIFQVPTYSTGYRFVLKEWLANKYESGLQMHCLPQHVIFSTLTAESCELLEVSGTSSCGPEGFISPTFVVRKHNATSLPEQARQSLAKMFHARKSTQAFSTRGAKQIPSEDPLSPSRHISEKKGGKPRVLIFGAFGNGNMGDIYQAPAMRAHLKSAWGLESASIFACSLLKRSDYPFPEDQKLPSRAIYDLDLINSFDALVIGGGGLLAHPHEPLSNDPWVRQVRIPILLVSVGASREQIPLHRGLLKKALFVSVRDTQSMAAVKRVRDDVVYSPDPILAATSLDALTEFDRSTARQEKASDLLWILKYPLNDHDRKMLDSIKTFISNNRNRTHKIVAIEPIPDRALDGYFQETPVIYIDQLSDLIGHMAHADAVFSMRYHGAIFSLLLGRRTFGTCQSKIRDLFRDLRGDNTYLDRPEEIGEFLQGPGVSATQDQLDDMRSKFRNTFMAFNPIRR